MKKLMILTFAIMCFAVNANAASIEDRAATIKSNLKGDESYHAHMARALSDVAEDEKGHREVAVARAFMDEAEKHMIYSLVTVTNNTLNNQ